MGGMRRERDLERGESKTQAIRVEKWKNRVRGDLLCEGEGKIMQRYWKVRRYDKQH